MSIKQERSSQVNDILVNKSVILNEGAFLIRINRSDVNQSDLLKQCLYGDAFPSAYSPYISMIPVSIFLPQMFQGKNIFMEHKSSRNNAKIPLMDSFLPFAFLIHESGHHEIKSMYDKIFKSKDDQLYGDVYQKMKKSVMTHTKNVKGNINFPFEKEQLNDTSTDEQTENFLRENSDSYSIVFLTAHSAVRLLQSENQDLMFGNGSDSYFVQVATSAVAKFDGISNPEHSYNVKFSSRIFNALKREMITLIQFYVGFEKRPEESIQKYIENMNFLFNDQLKSISCVNEENVESYSLSALKLFLSRNLLDEINTTSLILTDNDYEETIRKKVLFQLLMIFDVGSCFNARNLRKHELTKDKPSIVSVNPYTNPFQELHGAVYENVSWITHLTSMSLFYGKVKNRKCCETCEQKICAINVPSLMFTFSTNMASNKKEKTSAVLSFNTSNNYNKTGPLGNLRNNDSKEKSSEDKIVVWEKHHRDIFNSLLDSYNLDFSLLSESTPTTDGNIEERAEKFMDRICSQLDNMLSYCEQFFCELDDGAESIMQVKKTETEIRNVYRVANLYDKGFINILLSESLQYVLRCILLFVQTNMKDDSVNDVFLKVRPALTENKSGFDVTHITEGLSLVTLQKIVVKSYKNDGMLIDVQCKVSENYNISELVYDASFKNKSYLFGRFDEKKNNGSKFKGNMIQNMANRKSGGMMSSMVLNNSFLYFKNFCSKQACSVFRIQDDDFCRDIFNEIRDEKLDRYAYLFKYVNQFKVEDWSSMSLLVSVFKILEYLRFQPSYDRINFMTFNKLVKSEASKNYTFQQCLMDDDFNKYETVYAQNCAEIEFNAEVHGKTSCFKKCSGKYLDSHNELLNAFSSTKMHPGCPIFYFPLGDKYNKFKSSTNLFTKFINEEQYKLEKDTAYTNYIRKHKKQIYDCLFEDIFSDYENYIENRYTPEILEEMLSEFDERYPPTIFANGKIHEFLRLVLEQYFNPDQTRVQVMAKRIKEIYMKVKSRSRKRQHEEEESISQNQTESNVVQSDCRVDEDDDDDAESQFLKKKPKLN